jgi:hypothetical protein
MSIIQAAMLAGGRRMNMPASFTATDLRTGTPALAGVTLTSGGDIQRQLSGGTVDQGDWVTPKNGMSSYEAQMVPSSGTLDSGAVNTWQALSFTRSYEIGQATAGTKTFTGTLQVRAIGTTTPVSQSTVSLSATRE